MSPRPAVVGHDSSVLAPQRPTHPLVLRSRGPVGKPEEAAVDTQPVATVGVVLLCLIAVAEVESLGGGEVASLAERKALEGQP